MREQIAPSGLRGVQKSDYGRDLGTLNQRSLSAPVLQLPHFTGYEIAGRLLLYTASIVCIGAFALVVSSPNITIAQTVDAIGALEPASMTVVHSSTRGTVVSVFAKAGDSVSRGQRLIQFDTTGVVNRIQQLELSLAIEQTRIRELQASLPMRSIERHAKHSNAQMRLQRAKAVLRQRMGDLQLFEESDSLIAGYVAGRNAILDVAVADVEDAVTEVRKTAAEISGVESDSLELQRLLLNAKRIEVEIEEQRTLLSRASIVAPVDGVITTEGLEHLQSSLIDEGGTLLTIASRRFWHARLVVREADAHRVRIGDLARLFVPALSATGEHEFQGRVISVSQEPLKTLPPEAQSPLGAATEYQIHVQLVEGTAQKELAAARRGLTVRAVVISAREPLHRVIRNWLVSRR